jgi:hypothetical protein
MLKCRIELSQLSSFEKAVLVNNSILPATTCKHQWAMLQYTHTHLPDTYLAAWHESCCVGWVKQTHVNMHTKDFRCRTSG